MERRKDKKNRVLKEGEYQRNDLSYEYKWRDPTGHRHSIYATTLDELRKKEEIVKKDILDGIKPQLVNKISLNEMYDKWLQIKRGTIKDNTLQNYIYMYSQYVRDGFGKRKLNEIRKSDIRAFYVHLLTKRSLKAATIDAVNTVLLQVFTLAVDDGHIRANPCTGAFKEFKKAAAVDKPTRNALTVQQQDLLEEYLSTVPQARQWYPIITVLLYTGLRVGECAGLRWCDLDFENKMIDINHTLVYYSTVLDPEAKRPAYEGHCKFAVNTPKTSAGRRKIPMMKNVEDAFLMEKRRQEELGMKCEIEIDGFSDFVFLNRFGIPFYCMTLNKAFRRIVRDCNLWAISKCKDGELPPGLLPNFSCHILRHTFVTRSVEANMSLKALTAILGHSTAEITLDVYAEASDEFKTAEMRRIEEEVARRKLEKRANYEAEESRNLYDHPYDQNTTNGPLIMTSCDNL